MAVSRSREYEADRLGGEIAGHPRGLANALQRLEAGRHAIPNESAEANPATAHLFIVNPLSGAGMDNLFSTHPSTENRVRALMELAGGTAVAPARVLGAGWLERSRGWFRERPLGRRPAAAPLGARRPARPLGLTAGGLSGEADAPGRRARPCLRRVRHRGGLAQRGGARRRALPRPPRRGGRSRRLRRCLAPPLPAGDGGGAPRRPRPSRGSTCCTGRTWRRCCRSSASTPRGSSRRSWTR